MKIKCLIVDDESLAQDVLEEYINKIDALELVGKCNNAVEAFNTIQNQEIDLMFLDIQMPQLNGVDFLRGLKNPPNVIFTTAYSDYALEGFELDVLDYLLKPIPFDRFMKAVNKMFQVKNIPLVKESVSESPQAGNSDEPFIFLKTDKLTVKVFLKDILFIESQRNYVKIVTDEGEIMTYKTITYMEEKLPENLFLRVHRSFIVAIQKINSFSNYNININKHQIPIGRNYKDTVLEYLEGLNLL